MKNYLLAFAAFAVLTGCPPGGSDGGMGGGSGGGTAGGTGGGTAGGTGGGTAGGTGGGTAGGTGGGSAGGTGGGTSGPAKIGGITLTQSRSDDGMGGTITQTIGVATFNVLTVVGTPPVSQCTTHTIGNCTSQRCPIPAPVDAGSDAGMLIDTHVLAGVISVGGSRVDGGIFFIPNTTTDRYPLLTYHDITWDNSDTLTLSATGDTVPAFSAQDLIVPNFITVISPVCDSNICDPIPRSTPYTVTWSGGGAGVVNLSLTSIVDPPDGSGSGIQCKFPPTDGSGTIPVALLQDLYPGNGSLTINAGNSTLFASGDFVITFGAYTGALANVVAPIQ